MSKNLLFTLFVSIALVLAIGPTFNGCSKQPTEPFITQNTQSGLPIDTTQSSDQRKGSEQTVTASLTIAWPFGPYQLMSDWNGWQNDRTPGMSGSFCSGTRSSTHSGAEYYARDLNQNRGLDDGIMVFAGIAGKVVFAGWQNGYGNTVVIYDQSRHVAIRYAHLSYIYTAGVPVGGNIPVYRFLGRTGSTGLSTDPHLHIVGYQNINDNNGHPIIPTTCDSDFYACCIYFYWWTI